MDGGCYEDICCSLNKYASWNDNILKVDTLFIFPQLFWYFYNQAIVLFCFILRLNQGWGDYKAMNKNPWPACQWTGYNFPSGYLSILHEMKSLSPPTRTCLPLLSWDTPSPGCCRRSQEPRRDSGRLGKTHRSHFWEWDHESGARGTLPSFGSSH